MWDVGAQVYGEDVETMVQEEDTMMLNEPIIAPVTEKKFAKVATDIPETKYSKEYVHASTRLRVHVPAL